jgi:hypothetical protein
MKKNPDHHDKSLAEILYWKHFYCLDAFKTMLRNMDEYHYISISCDVLYSHAEDILNNIDSIQFLTALQDGEYHLFRYFMDKKIIIKTRFWSDLLVRACKLGSFDMVKLLFDYSSMLYTMDNIICSRALLECAKRDQDCVPCMKLFEDRICIVDNYSSVLCVNDNMEGLRYLHSKGLIHVKQTFERACKSGALRIVVFLHEELKALSSSHQDEKNKFNINKLRASVVSLLQSEIKEPIVEFLLQEHPECLEIAKPLLLSDSLLYKRFYK